jgi:hypothetical protein
MLLSSLREAAAAVQQLEAVVAGVHEGAVSRHLRGSLQARIMVGYIHRPAHVCLGAVMTGCCTAALPNRMQWAQFTPNMRTSSPQE